MILRTWLLVGVALACGGATGFLVGKHSTPTKGPPPNSTPADAVSTPMRVASNQPPSSQPPTAGLNTADFESKLRALLSSPARKKYDRINDLARSIEATDATNALALAEKILPRQDYWSFRYRLLDKWAESDPQGVLAYGQSLKNRSDRQMAISAGLQEWARQDPEAALAWVDKQPRGQERQNLLSSALQGLAEGDPQKALGKLNSAPFYQRRWIRNQIIDKIAENDPKGAADLALQNDRGSRYGWGGEGKLGGVLQKWMSQDPDAAVVWLQSQPENVRKRRTVINAVQSLSWQDPANAMRLLELVPPGQQRQETLGNVLQSLADRDLDALQAWTVGRTDPREKASGQIAYASALVTKDPAAAAAALQNVHADERQSYAFQQVFNEYAQRDPQTALTLARNFTDTTARNQAISGALAAWGSS